MRFGIFFEHQIPRPWNKDTELKHFQASLDQMEVADRIGVHYSWAQEHHFLEEYSHSSSPEVFLAAASQRTKRIRLGQGIALMPPAYNHPARIAERIATLDLVSGGRVEWGTGESSSRLELEGFRVNYVDKRAMWAEGLRETIRMLCMEPYPGYEGRYFSSPPRNVVPKPVQSPHPPLWMACSSRDSLKRAARLGIGALTFAFMDAKEARFWVEEYYETFERECKPFGQAVNPNIAMLSGFMCHANHDTAVERGENGLRFFAWGLAHYLRTGTHTPGRLNLWEAFKEAPRTPVAGMGGIGSPERIRDHMREMEAAGVDQVILLQQAGGYDHDHITESLELFGEEVLPEFLERDQQAQQDKQRRLSAAMERAVQEVPTLEPLEDVPEVEAYPVYLEGGGVKAETLSASRSADAAALWRLHAGGTRKS